MSSLQPSGMLNRDQVKYFYLITACFAILLGYSIMKGMLFMAGLPVFFLICLIMIFRLDLIAFFSVIITPLSINLAHTSIGIGVSLPSEPLMFGIFMLFWRKGQVGGSVSYGLNPTAQPLSSL